MAESGYQPYESSRKRMREDFDEHEDYEEDYYISHPLSQQQPSFADRAAGGGGAAGFGAPRIGGFLRPRFAPAPPSYLTSLRPSIPMASFGHQPLPSFTDFESEQAEQTNLIVNYLPQTLSDEELHDIFIKCGPIESLRIMRDKQTGYSFGYGFVNYEQPSSAADAISTLNGLQVLNKSIKVSYARPPSVEIKDTNLYITNLPRSTTEQDLVRMFEPFGKIVQKNVLYDKYTNLPRGVAFVRYNLREEANAAIEAMNDFMPFGATECIKVRLAENHGKQKASYVAGFQAGYQKR